MSCSSQLASDIGRAAKGQVLWHPRSTYPSSDSHLLPNTLLSVSSPPGIRNKYCLPLSLTPKLPQQIETLITAAENVLALFSWEKTGLDEGTFGALISPISFRNGGVFEVSAADPASSKGL